MSVDYIDLQFRGSPRVIATALLNGPGGLTLIDPGPTSCLPVLEAGLRETIAWYQTYLQAGEASRQAGG